MSLLRCDPWNHSIALQKSKAATSSMVRWCQISLATDRSFVNGCRETTKFGESLSHWKPSDVFFPVIGTHKNCRDSEAWTVILRFASCHPVRSSLYSVWLDVKVPAVQRKKREPKWDKSLGNARNAEIYDLCKIFSRIFLKLSDRSGGPACTR